MRVPVLILSCVISISCSTTPKSASMPVSDLILSPTPWFSSIENLKADRCHTQLTDLQEMVAQEITRHHKTNSSRQQLESLYLKRMALQQKISDWFIEDKNLSVECVLLGAQIQQVLRQREDEIGIHLYGQKKTWPQEQSVFMYSDQQLLSNIYVSATPSTALSDLKNGDIVVTLLSSPEGAQKPVKFLSLIRKNENESLESLTPITATKWVRISLDHPLSWLKQSVLQVVVLRSRNESKAQELVEKIMMKVSKEDFSDSRQPAADTHSVWSALNSSAWAEPESDPELQTLFEWKNYQALSRK